MHGAKDIESLDKSDIISWCRPSKDKKTIIPMCPHHGLPLNYSPENTELLALDDAILH